MSTQPAPSTPAPVARPQCQEHPDAIATGVCPRCGRFVCAECMEDSRVCPDCLVRQLGSLPSSAGRARWVGFFLGAHVLVNAGSALVSLLLSNGASEALEVAEGFLGFGYLAAHLGSVIAFLMWQHLAVRQAHALELPVGVSPAGAVTAWFIPFINLVKPYRVVRNLVGVLGGEGLVESAHVGLWWGLWLACNILSQLELRLSMRQGWDGSPSPGVHLLGVFASLATLAAALLCRGVVRAVQRELDLRRQ